MVGQIAFTCFSGECSSEIDKCVYSYAFVHTLLEKKTRHRLDIICEQIL